MNNLAEIRNKKGMTQAELADACGVTQKTISALEVNRRNPSYELLIRLTKALDVTPNELVTDGSNAYGCTADELAADPEENEGKE